MTRPEEDYGTVTEQERQVDVPKRYRVILLNDDYTSMEFVILVLEGVFHKSEQEAQSLMMSIHETGSGVAGVYSFEIAEMKTVTVTELARRHEYPLRCIMEEDE